jgi:hypothetical protein
MSGPKREDKKIELDAFREAVTVALNGCDCNDERLCALHKRTSRAIAKTEGKSNG